MTLAGAEGWYFICESVSAGHTSFFSHLPAAPSVSAGAERLACADLDVNMADAPIFWTPPVGTKRARDDDADEDVVAYELRLEKVGDCLSLI